MEGEQAEVSENRKEVEDSRIERLDQDVVNKSEQKQILSTQTKIPNQVKDKDTRVKIDVLLKATGDAPIMKKKKWAVDRNKQVAYLIDFIKKYIKCDPSESLFLYVNQTFVPSPDQQICSLYECFGTDGKLVLHYCKTEAWG